MCENDLVKVEFLFKPKKGVNGNAQVCYDALKEAVEREEKSVVLTKVEVTDKKSDHKFFNADKEKYGI